MILFVEKYLIEPFQHQLGEKICEAENLIFKGGLVNSLAFEDSKQRKIKEECI